MRTLSKRMRTMRGTTCSRPLIRYRLQCRRLTRSIIQCSSSSRCRPCISLTRTIRQRLSIIISRNSSNSNSNIDDSMSGNIALLCADSLGHVALP